MKMKQITHEAPYKGSLIYPSKLPVKLKKVLIWAILANLGAFIFIPAIFHGFWDGVGGIFDNLVEARTNYYVTKKYGRTAATFRQTANIYKSLPSAMNPMNWGR